MLWTGRAHCQRQVAFFFVVVEMPTISQLFFPESVEIILYPHIRLWKKTIENQAFRGGHEKMLSILHSLHRL